LTVIEADAKAIGYNLVARKAAIARGFWAARIAAFRARKLNYLAGRER
jgi:hypothetical protein